MNYEIQSESDFLAGSHLVVKIPETELDQNALQTVQTDCPDFILPFHYKNVDGHIELIYKIGTMCKMRHVSGDLTPKKYVELWQNLLNPLLICGDWFMKPNSFVIKADYLYYDKNTGAVRYVYIPSSCGCSENDAFYEMAVEISKMMTVSDAVLENRVLRAVIKDFNPSKFLQMLNDYTAESEELFSSAPISDNRDEQIKTEKTEETNNEFVYGSNIEVLEVNEKPVPVRYEQSKKERELGGYRLFSSRGKKKNSSISRDLESAQFFNEQTERDTMPQNIPGMPDSPGFSCVGRAGLPPLIKVSIKDGEIFTIGRFNAAVGKKQSNFEFDKKTKAVSHRHAVIERSVNEYRIIDLSSNAGTFVNDKKVPPNTPIGLEKGCRVSFGNSGADYIWEVS